VKFIGLSKVFIAQPVLTGSGKLMVDPRINCAVNGFDVARDLPNGFLEVLLPLHQEFAPRQQ
jgi:hypothetical protein